MTIEVKVTPSGRISLPADVRRRLGLKSGDRLLLDEQADALVLRTAAQAVAHARAISDRLLAGKKGAAVGDFLKARKDWQE
ncbi:MAG TPA: AbrB/MazE/SpoVT family DNA-binding domain-containing protein [Sphingomonas sp.]|nr:AbrB/MazE/SpoVT family DNA-binding domain-containing protein [Sphingomonas sp.]